MKILRFGISLLLVNAVVLSVSVGLMTVPVSAAPPTPKANWSPCYRDFGFPFECATVQVPLDYNEPGTAAISVAMIRLPASDPAQRIGSLFINPGGPGGSGVDVVLGYGPFLYSNQVRARFDIVGFDPRGIARSTALRCFGTPRQWWTAPFAFPTTPEEEAILQAVDLYLADACEQRAGRIIDHMTTADVARDLDLLRQAVGDEGLTYVGYSYGSYLGVTYANLFPDNVRALVVDGVLDPIAWSTGVGDESETWPFSTRLRSDAGALETLNQFFQLCDAGGPNCAFGPDSANRFAALADSLRAEPIFVTLPDGSTFIFTYADLIGNTLGAMYDSFGWPAFAQFLAAIEGLASPAEIGTRLHALWQDLGLITKRGFPQYPNYVEGFPGVACTDTDNPDSFAAWSVAAAAAEADYGYFGPIWTWLTSICAVWPGAKDSRYAGPFDAATANPVLVASTLYDPATRYEGAVTVAGLLPNSRLLTVEGWGHTTLFLSQCADQAVSSYLLDGTLPPEGTVCQQDLVPFIDFSAVAASEAATARARVIPAMIPDVIRPRIP